MILCRTHILNLHKIPGANCCKPLKAIHFIETYLIKAESTVGQFYSLASTYAKQQILKVQYEGLVLIAGPILGNNMAYFVQYLLKRARALLNLKVCNLIC